MGLVVVAVGEEGEALITIVVVCLLGHQMPTFHVLEVPQMLNGERMLPWVLATTSLATVSVIMV